MAEVAIVLQAEARLGFYPGARIPRRKVAGAVG
jgi:hypothetical protein